MTRSFVPFEALWGMKIDVPYSFLVRDGELAWSCGQLALDHQSNVMAPNDLVRQSEIICDYVEAILARAELSPAAIKRIYLYYLHATDQDHDAMLATFRQRLGGAVLLDPIPVPHFYYDGVVLEVDVFCALGESVTGLTDSNGLSFEAISASGLTWLTVTPEPGSLPKLADLLLEALAIGGDPFSHVLSEQWFAPTSALPQVSADLSAVRPTSIAAGIVDTGSTSDQIFGLMTVISNPEAVISERHIEANGVEGIARRSGQFAWVQARCPSPELTLVEQTRRLMPCIQEALEEFGMTFANVVKSTTHYVGGATAGDLHDNMAVRNACYRKPGPASTGVPVFGFAAQSCKVAVDVTAVGDSR